MKISPARRAAFEILSKIETEKAFSSVLLPAYEERLGAPDRALCHELTLGVLRRQIYLDRVLASFAPGKKLDAPVRIALRVGLDQLLVLDKIPSHAAINESVNLAQLAKKTSAKGLVNAVLRRASREGPAALRFADLAERIAVETSHPRWLVEKWTADFGPAETEKLARANNSAPRLAFRLTGKTPPDVAGRLGGYARSALVEGAFIAERADENLRALAAAGAIYFQDEGSQLVARAVELEEGGNFLDVCAAPGGKTTLAVLAGAEQNLVAAGDLHWPRAEFLRENCRRQGADFVNVVQYDAFESLPFAEESFDVALLDAPCSGTGTIRHNPEIRYFLEKEDFRALSRKQLGILQNASKLIKRGGKLVYATCSLEKEENEEVCARFLAANGDFQLIGSPLGERFFAAGGFARTFPQRDQTDGFFVAAFEKRFLAPRFS